MGKLTLGVLYYGLDDVVGPLEFAQWAEEMGFDYLWVSDMLLQHTLDALSLLSAVAAKTQYIRLGTCVVVLPFRHPLHWAKTALTVDLLSSGRLTLGIGIGGGWPEEFRALGVEKSSRGRMSDESLEAILRLFTETNVTHRGQFYSFEDVTLGPPSVQKPHIPIWVGGEWHGGIAEGVIKRAARFGDGFIPAGLPAAAYPDVKRRIEEHAKSCGRDISSFGWGIDLRVCLGDNGDEARKVAEAVSDQRLGYHWPLTQEGPNALGTSKDCIKTIERYISAGVNHLNLYMLCPPAEAMHQCSVMVKEVLPHFRG